MTKVRCESIYCPLRAEEQLLESSTAMMTEVLGICAVSTMVSEAAAESTEPECKGAGPTISVNTVQHTFPKIRHFMRKPPVKISYKYICKGVDE